MTTFGDAVYMLGGVPVASGLGAVGLAGGNWYFCDPTNGNDGYTGLTPVQAKKTLLAAYNLCRNNMNDGVIFLGGAISDTPLVPFTWTNSFCHLIGANDSLPGMGQRSRLVNSSTYNLATLITFSGDGCLVANMQFFDGKNSAADGQCVVVSGGRNHFVNCYFAGMGDATASGPATRSGSFSLEVTGQENTFEKCVIGLDTIVRSAANAELVVTGPRNYFNKCELRSNSVTAGKFLVQINAAADMRDIVFEDCLFFNYSQNWATGITNAFNMLGSSTVWVTLKGNCIFVGNGLTVGDTVTHIYGAGYAPNAGMFIATNPTS